MNDEEIEKYLIDNRHCEYASFLRKLLTSRREGYRDKLEGVNDEVVRGRAKECKDLLSFLVDN